MVDIIVVDDDPGMVELLTEFLTEDGYKVRTAANGLEALKLLIAERPHLLLVDIMMPVMHGLTLWYYLKKDPELAQIPVVMMSGAKNKPLLNECDHQGFLVKPFDAETLLTLVHALVGEAGGAGG